MVTGAWPEVHGNAAYGIDGLTNVAFGQTRRLDAQSIAEVVGAAGGLGAGVHACAPHVLRLYTCLR